VDDGCRGGDAVVLAFLLDPRLGAILSVWFGAWALNAILANRARGAGIRFFVPILFGATLLGLWEMAVRLYEISPIILPAPSAIAPPLPRTLPCSGPISGRRS
jgi:NitT/TauT family transport system permease protein